MKKYEILYDWPVRELTRLADSDVAETFASGLASAPLTMFTVLTETMRGLGVDLARAKSVRQHFDRWDVLLVCLQTFEQEFGTFPDAQMSKFRMFALLANKLTQAAPQLDADEINAQTFEFYNLLSPIPIAWFSQENGRSFAESFAVFSCADVAALEVSVNAGNISPLFLFHFLAAVQATPDPLTIHTAFVKRVLPSLNSHAVDAFVRLKLIASGVVVHAPRNYQLPVNILDTDGIVIGPAYHQWNDTLNVLSEYNSRTEVLLKYLTIYHVIENFMFKLPIVELERQHQGRMFSIRDFRRLYRQVEKPESEAIKQLFLAVFSVPVSGTTTFSSHIINRWTALSTNVAVSDIEGALNALGLSFRYADFNLQRSAGCFAQLVYAMRNAIVHNKETEFHLTYAALDATFCAVIESFLIPSLEEISFALIGSPNGQVWYSNKELMLYR